MFAVLFADGIIGLLAGFSIRHLLVKRTVMLRVVMVFIFTLASLVFLGWFTSWRYGIGPLRWGSSEVGWLDLAQWLGAAGVSFLVFFAWKRAKEDQD